MDERTREQIAEGSTLARIQIEEQQVGFNSIFRGYLPTILDTMYPESVFDGSSGDKGPCFVVELRKLLKQLGELK